MIGERKFVVDSSKQRIWGLLLKAVLRCLALERMKPKSASQVVALLRVRIGPIRLPMDVLVDIVDISPPESLVTIIKARGMREIIWLDQRCTFTLTPISEGKTEVSCKMAEEGMSILLRMFLLPTVRNFARDTFHNLEELLRQWA